MGLLDIALDGLRRIVRASTRKAGTRPAWGGRAPDPEDYGRAGAPTPDMDSLVSDAEIEAVTGGVPTGDARRNGVDGTDVDLGRLVIRESKLSNGDTFLISLNNCANADAARLAMDRMAEYEKPLDGVGERALVRVKRSAKKGTSEIGVTALQGNFTLALVHTSTAGATSPEPLAELLRTALRRL